MSAPLSMTGWMRYDIIRRCVDEVAPSSILELGVGMAGVSSRLPEQGYVGVEPDDVSRSIAQQRLPGRRILGAIDDLGDDERFDLVCAFEVIEHIEDHHAVAAQWASRLAPGGHLLLSTPANSGRFGAWDRASGHYRRYDRPDIETLAEAAGLVDVQVWFYGFPIGNAFEELRNIKVRRSDRLDKPMDEITADSARQLQPSSRFAPVAEFIGTTAARLQRPLDGTERGLGLVMMARRPG